MKTTPKLGLVGPGTALPRTTKPSTKARTIKLRKGAQQASVLGASNPVARAQRLAQAGAAGSPVRPYQSAPAQPSLVQRLGVAPGVITQPGNPMTQLPMAQPMANAAQLPAQPAPLQSRASARPPTLPPLNLNEAIRFLQQMRNMSKPE